MHKVNPAVNPLHQDVPLLARTVVEATRQLGSTLPSLVPQHMSGSVPGTPPSAAGANQPFTRALAALHAQPLIPALVSGAARAAQLYGSAVMAAPQGLFDQLPAEPLREVLDRIFVSCATPLAALSEALAAGQAPAAAGQTTQRLPPLCCTRQLSRQAALLHRQRIIVYGGGHQVHRLQQ